MVTVRSIAPLMQAVNNRIYFFRFFVERFADEVGVSSFGIEVVKISSDIKGNVMDNVVGADKDVCSVGNDKPGSLIDAGKVVFFLFHDKSKYMRGRPEPDVIKLGMDLRLELVLLLSMLFGKHFKSSWT